MNFINLDQRIQYAALFAEIRLTMRRYPKDAPLTLEGLQTILVNACERQAQAAKRKAKREEARHWQIMNDISFFGQD